MFYANEFGEFDAADCGAHHPIVTIACGPIDIDAFARRNVSHATATGSQQDAAGRT
jgi:hypothetical protein